MTNATATELQQETGLYDMTNLSRMKSLTVHAPEVVNTFVAFDKVALSAAALRACGAVTHGTHAMKRI